MFLCVSKILAGALLISISVGLKFGSSRKSVEQKLVLKESSLIEESFHKALQYLLNNPESIKPDVILGVLIARANLQWITNRLRHNEKIGEQREKLINLINNCDFIVNTASTNGWLFKSDLWQNAAGNLSYGVLIQREGEINVPVFDSCDSIEDYMMKGTPENSDWCVNDLLTSNCNISDYCWYSETNHNYHSGYKTSHRLLYFQLANQMNCKKLNPEKFHNITFVKTELCHQIFLETKALFQKPSLSLTRDLLMENIALCGLEGFEEFASNEWRSQVMNWQSSSGCFGFDENFKICSSNPDNDKNIVKKSDFVFNECHTHVTAVGISALAFFIRVILKNALNLPLQ